MILKILEANQLLSSKCFVNLQLAERVIYIYIYVSSTIILIYFAQKGVTNKHVIFYKKMQQIFKYGIKLEFNYHLIIDHAKFCSADMVLIGSWA